MDAGFVPADLSGLALPPRAWLGWARHGAGDTRRARDFAAGRLAAARSLASWGQEAWGQEGAVPRRADGAPCWPRGVVGAITHRGGLALALTGRAGDHAGLGLDLETLIQRPGEIARVILAPEERARLDPDPLTITVIFSAKESLFKALYPQVGVRFGFDAAELAVLRPGGGVLRLTRAIGPWGAGAAFPFLWSRLGGQVVTALSAAQPRSVAPPST